VSQRQRNFFGAHVCKVMFKHLPQPLRMHMQSLGTRQKQRKEKREKEKHAGAELCQAQVQLHQAARWSKFT
jgi:hypothetical protein